MGLLEEEDRVLKRDKKKNNGEESKEKKREKREKKDKDSYVQDMNVSGREELELVVSEKDQSGTKHTKKRKLEHEEKKQEGGGVELVFEKKGKKQKRENRNKVEKGEGSYNAVIVGLGMGENEVEVIKEEEEEKKKKKKKKRKEEKYKSKEDVVGETQNYKEVGKSRENELESNKEEDVSVVAEVGEEYTIDEGKKETKKKKKKRKKEDKMGGDVQSLLVNSIDEHSTKDKKIQTFASNEERNKQVHVEVGNTTDSGFLKKRKKDKKSKNDIGDGSRETLENPVDIENPAVDDNEDGFSEGCSGVVVGKKKKDRKKGALRVDMEKLDKSTRKKGKSVNDVDEKSLDEGESRKKNKEEGADTSGNLKSKKPSKRVKFSGQVEIFPISDVRDVGKETPEEGLVHGKRYTQDEDKIIETAVLKYIKEHDLGDDGIKKVLRCSSYPEARNCWEEISAAIPWRPRRGIYNRAHILFERDNKRIWTTEELELVKKFHEKHGPDWRTLADEMDKSRIHVKDAWRRICLPNKKTGHWSQDEYQNLFDLVNMDLRMKILEEKKSKHGMLRDNIAWEAISHKLSTRTYTNCCLKWYRQLESPLVREKKWASSDDFRLLDELLTRDYSSVEEVDWDNLLDHRPGNICRKRWLQMVKHLGEHGNKAFADQVEVLNKRYCPDVLEAREAYENRAPVD